MILPPRVRQFLGRRRRNLRYWLLDRSAYLICGGRVRGGPFRGMVYSSGNIRRHTVSPKVLGTFEAELIPVFRWIMRMPFACFIDVGSAEGYYVVGLARQEGIRSIIAFDCDVNMQDELSRQAACNGVPDRIVQLGRADAASLSASLAGESEPFLMVDIEGDELELLETGKVPALVRTWMLVELHLGIHPDLIRIMQTRFAGTHRLFLFEQLDWPERRKIYERAGPTHWLSRYSRFRAERRAMATPWLLLVPFLATLTLDPDVIKYARPL